VQKGLIDINQPASQYIGAGWSSAPLAKENLITVKHLLNMTSGLDDGPPAPCDNEDSAKACLLYKVDAGTRWAYHTGAYKKVQDVVADAAGLNYNTVTQQWLKNKIGMGGLWIDQTYYSKARDMARFGILNLAQGKWATDTVMKDTAYFRAMTRSSQPFNQSYGYLWWLNGKSTYMNPGLQLQLPGPLIPNAPSDLYAGLGKNDQKIYIVPSTQMVVVRQGNSAEGVTFALSSFDNKMWGYINALTCNLVGIAEQAEPVATLYPNPAGDELNFTSSTALSSCNISDVLGRTHKVAISANRASLQQFENGVYYVIAVNGTALKQPIKFVKQN
jgi:CubicO group peptidase (beta-lactamase class C family)